MSSKVYQRVNPHTTSGHILLQHFCILFPLLLVSVAPQFDPTFFMMSKCLVQSGPVFIVKTEMTRTCERKLIKPFNFQVLLSSVHDLYVKGNEK